VSTSLHIAFLIVLRAVVARTGRPGRFYHEVDVKNRRRTDRPAPRGRPVRVAGGGLRMSAPAAVRGGRGCVVVVVGPHVMCSHARQQQPRCRPSHLVLLPRGKQAVCPSRVRLCACALLLELSVVQRPSGEQIW
jgi:hypothetical protein